MTARLVTACAAALLAAAVPVSLIAGGGRAEEGALDGTISIAGSSTVYPISVAVSEEFYRLHPNVQIPIQSTGTGGGFKNFFIPGKTMINDASRPIEESERQEALENGIEPVEFQVAVDAITVVVNPGADWVDDLSVEELARIWRPDNPAKKWSDVRPEWPAQEIELYGPTAASGTFDYFTEEIVGESGASRSDYQGTEQDNTIVQAVSGSKYALGYFGMAYYLENQDRVKALAVNGVKPGIAAAKSGEYTPLSRPIFIYVARNALERPEVREFVRFYLEQTSTDLIRQVGYVPLTEEDREANLQKLREVLAGTGM
jgi:phosphate transport system substrate-binding protein